MTSLIRKSYVMLRTYRGISRRLMLRVPREPFPVIARSISQSAVNWSAEEKDRASTTALSTYAFNNVKDKEKKAYLEVLRMYIKKEIHRRGHVEFIYTAMKYMEEFGVEKDLEAYKSLLNVFPKGKLIPRNAIQAAFMHYPKQQQCAIDVLDKMEHNGIIPDIEMETILLNTFGKTGFPLRKYWRMMYWMPKFKNASPWPLPDSLPDDALELAKLAIDRITSVDVRRQITVFQPEDVQDSIDKTWVVSGMSPDQEELLAKHSPKVPIYVEGPFRIWLKKSAINYFILRADSEKKPEPEFIDEDDVSQIKMPLWNLTPAVIDVKRSVHEQEDGTIFAVCATGTSSRDSLLSWIRCLEKKNVSLSKIPVLFTSKSPLGEVVLADEKLGDSKKVDTEKIENK